MRISDTIPWLIALSAASASAQDYGLPSNVGVLNVRSFGARGDSITDDTKAFTDAIAASAHWQTIYVPDGVYLVSGTISWDQHRNVQGQSREKTVIRLKDHCTGYGAGASKPVLRCFYNNNQSIGNYVEHLTVNTGRGNPGAVGIRFNAHNHGACRDVRIVSGDGAGMIGLDMTETEFGPALVKDVTVEGFDKGMVTVGSVSHGTFERITLRGQRVAGFENNMPASIRGLTSVNTVPALRIGDFYLAHTVLLDARLTGGSAQNCAIENRNGELYLRNVTTGGYRALMDDKGTVVAGPDLPGEYVRGTVKTLFDSPRGHLNLPVEDTPEDFIEPESQWLIVTQAMGQDTLQKAIDNGCRTICFACPGDPGRNLTLSRPLYIRNKVRRVIGLNRTLVGSDLILDGAIAEPLVLDRLWGASWGAAGCFRVRGSQTVFFKSCQLDSIVVESGSTARVFIDDLSGRARIYSKGSAWLRQYNPENTPEGHLVNFVNRGGAAWILGFKTEWVGVNCETSAGGRTEVLGGFFRDHVGSTGYPYFVTSDAQVSASYVMYDWSGCGNSRGWQARETRGGVTRDMKGDACNLAMTLYSGWQTAAVRSGAAASGRGAARAQAGLYRLDRRSRIVAIGHAVRGGGGARMAFDTRGRMIVALPAEGSADRPDRSMASGAAILEASSGACRAAGLRVAVR